MAHYPGLTDSHTSIEEWRELLFGSYSMAEILEAVADPGWQSVRLTMKGMKLVDRKTMLEVWLHDNQYSERSKIQVTNYVYALKRGGMVK